MKKVTLKDICIDGKGSYGIGASAVDYDFNLPTYLRITDINDDGTVNHEELKSVNDPESNKYFLEKNDIVFARTGNSTGKAYFYDERDGRFVYAGFLIKFTLDEKKVNPKYIKLYTLTNKYKNWVNSFSTGSTRANINAKGYGDMPLELPDREVQNKIVKIIEPLNDKIRINNGVNKTLEEMVHTLFKRWFIDFEFPNQNGEPYKSSGGEMVESELGEIPLTWNVKILGDVTKNIREKIGKKEAKVLSAVKTGELQLSEEYFTKQVYSKDISKYIEVTKYDFAYNPARINIGSIGIFEEDYCGAVSPVYVVFRSEIDYHWYFKFLIKTPNIKTEIENRSFGSVRQSLAYKDFSLIKIKYPDLNTIHKFNKIYESIYAMQKKIIKENKSLEQIRDTLLLKLMN